MSAWRAAAVAACAGVAAALSSSAAPTGGGLVDRALLATTVAVGTCAAASVGWVWLLGAAALAVVTVGEPVWVLAGLVAGLLALVVGALRTASISGHDATLRAASAGMTLVALANSALDVRFGLSSAIALLIGQGLVIGGLRQRPTRVRRRAWLALGALSSVALASVASLGASAWMARELLTSGRVSAEAGLRSVRAGEYDRAATYFTEAAELFARANGRLRQPWTAPAAVVPVAAQHRRIALDLTHSGALASATAAEALSAIDTDRLRLEGGRIDLDALGELGHPLDDAVGALDSMMAAIGDESSPWLVGPLAEALDELRVELGEADARLEDASLAIAVAPRLLGADGEQRYLVVFTTPVEARALGFPGNFAELVVDGGAMSMADFGRVADLEHRGMEVGARLTGPEELLDQYRQFLVRSDNSVGVATWRNVTMTPDFPKAAAAMAELYEQITGRRVDGVLLVDPYVVATLISYTGPIELAAADMILDHTNALQYILIDQYAATVTAEGNVERIDALDEAAHGMIGAVLAGALPDPVELAGDLAPLVEGGHLRFWSPDPDVAELTHRVNLDGGLPPRDGGDGFAMTVANASGSKIDYFLERSLAYDAETDEGGTTMATLTATLTNTAPTSGYPDFVIGNVIGLPAGASRLYVSLYSPLELRWATVDGERRALGVGFEGEWNVYSTFVTIESGESVSIELDLGGRVDDPGRLVTWEQPLVRPAAVEIDVRTP